MPMESSGAPGRVDLSRRRFVKLSGGLLIGGAATSLLAACGGGAAAPTSAPAKPAAPAPAASPAASPAVGASPAASPGASPAAVTSPAASPAAAAQTGPLPTAKQGASLKILLWSHFVPAYDDWFDNYAKQWGETNKVSVSVDHIRNADIPARLAAEASAGAGHDLFEFQAVIQTNTYADKLVDLTNIANAVGQKYGGWLDVAKSIGVVEGQWKAMLTYLIVQPHLHRVDYFKEVGYDKFPDDYPTLLEATAKLKEQGHPCGLPLSHCNDGNHNWRSVIYSFGGTEQSPDGQKVTIASDETLSAIKFGVDLFNR